MKQTILVTGAEGFIGKNLCVALEQDKEIKLLKFDRENSIHDLEDFVFEADFIYHLAGINRPKESEEFDKGNRGLTEELIKLTDKKKKPCPIAITSSIQAELDNPYGKSKKAAEEALFDWSKKSGVEVFVYRLPNVFGKWCKPNYNSVVATFCHNIANDLPLQISDSKTELTLVYIDDVINELILAKEGKANIKQGGFCEVRTKYQLTLKELSNAIQSFRESRDSLVIPDFKEPFKRALYATYTTYLSDDDFGYPLEIKHDNRGWLSEFIKSDNFGQIFISKTKPGITRGNHWHHTKIEKFLVIEGEADITFKKIGSNKVIKYNVTGAKLMVLDIPAGYTHAIKNTGKTDLITLFWSDEIFNPEKPDTYFLEVENG